MQRAVRFALIAALASPAGLYAQTASSPETELPLKHAPRPTSPAITPADLMTRLYIFADDSMLGRETGQIGDVKATDYLAREARRMGLEPAGDDGTYFQTVPVKTRTLDKATSFAVDGTPLELGREYLPMARSPFAGASLPIVYGGVLGDSVHTLGPERARGKLVVLSLGGPVQPFRMYRMLRRGLDVGGAAAVAVAGLDSVSPRFRGYLTRPRTFIDEGSANQNEGTPVFLVTRAAAARMLGGSLAGRTVGAAGGTASIDLRFDDQPLPHPARNVVAIVPGSDPGLKNEYVAIGAHNDHIGVADPVDHDSIRMFNRVVRPEGADDRGEEATPGQMREVDSLLALYRHGHPDRIDSISNGADDDGSGSVTALEIAEKIQAMDPHPARSILFVWHTGEEKGLLGSRYFTDHPTVPRDSIVAQLNMDMVGRGDRGDQAGRTKLGTRFYGDARFLAIVGSRRLSTELGDLIERVNREDGHDLLFDYSFDVSGHPDNIYCRSDHYEYARYGIPIAFFTTGLHEDYHQVTDEPEYIDYDHMARVAKLVEDVAVHVANLDHRPVVDGPKPDPGGRCQQ